MKRKKRRIQSKASGAPRWMVTFSDLVTLILVFFILLFSMSQIDNVKFQSMANSFRQQAAFDENPSIVPGDYPNEQQQAGGQSDLDELYEKVQSFLKENSLEQTADVTRDERGVVLVLNEQFLFGSGESELMPVSYPFLDGIGALFKDLPNMIKVEGHTDNVPIQDERYPSNWELSSARSSSVIRYFVEEHSLSPGRFMAVGYADTRSIAPNSSEENRRKNRRVEMIIMDPDLEEKTEQAPPDR